jgi:integrase
MPTTKIDNTAALTASCPHGKAKETYFDTALTGFVIEVRPNGSKTFALRYRDAHGRQRQYKIGRYPDITADRARREAAKIKARSMVGENPAEQRHAIRRIPTVSELSEQYLDYVRSYKRSADIDERYLRLHLLPKFGRLHLDQLNQTEIMDWLSSKVADGYAQATVNRWQVILGHMMNMAAKWGLPGAERNPLEGVRQKDPNNRVERFLSPEETRRLKAAVEASPNTNLRFVVALLLLTGCRKRELLDAKWDEFDLSRRSWRIPMSKTGKARHVPLSDDAMGVLHALPRHEGCPYLIPNPDTMKPYTSVFHAWDNARRRAGLPELRMHDLRHSAASNMANSGQSLYVIGSILGHAQAKTTERYAHLSNDTLQRAVNAASQFSGTNWALNPA